MRQACLLGMISLQTGIATLQVNNSLKFHSDKQISSNLLGKRSMGDFGGETSRAVTNKQWRFSVVIKFVLTCKHA